MEVTPMYRTALEQLYHWKDKESWNKPTSQEPKGISW